MSGIELVCINLGESVLSWAEKFLKNLHLPHPSKLGETRLSFERRCTFGNSFLHRFCTFCTRRGRLRDELDAPEQPASVGVVRVDSEDLATYVLFGVCVGSLSFEESYIGRAYVLSVESRIRRTRTDVKGWVYPRRTRRAQRGRGLWSG